jgi:DNA helicase HerA-like ATPase
LGAEYDLLSNKFGIPLNYDARDLTTHGICFGMTGSGKTGLCVGLLEEAALDKVPAILIDPKGDLTNLLLQFPEQKPKDFLPWLNPDDARRKDMTIDGYSKYIAEFWRNGLLKWGIGQDRIRLLMNSIEYTIYTPGSDAGFPISILNSFAAPNKDFDENAEIIRERINGTVAAILTLSGVKVDPIRSREAILLSTIFEHYWRKNEDLNLEKIILAVQNPPVRRLGVFDVDSFYPEKDRFELAIGLNSLVASPSFQSWLHGEPLDIKQILYTEKGKPRHSIFYIAHLSEKERMFFITLLLEQILLWTRSQTGTTSLRALLYIDEVFGFFPPIAEPPSKRPLMTLLKQARAFGLGVLLVTQNPVDIDYKGLTNAGTWFIGKLQTERDKDRVLHGLKGAISASGANDEKIDYDAMISQLSSRIFLMHNVHEKKPKIFHTRWVMSYLRGPMTRPQVRELMKSKKNPVGKDISFQPTFNELRKIRTGGTKKISSTSPVLGPSISQVFFKPKLSRREATEKALTIINGEVDLENVQLIYEPSLIGSATVRFVDRKNKIDKRVEKTHLVQLDQFKNVSWERAKTISIKNEEPKNNPILDAEYGSFYDKLPEQLANPQEFKSLKKNYSNWLYQNSRLAFRIHAQLGVVERPKDNERDFFNQLQQAARERRDIEVDKLERKYQKQLDKLDRKMRKLEREVTADEEEYKARKREEMIGAGESVLGFFLGRRRTRDVSTIARKRRLTSKAKMNMEETQEEILELKKDIELLEEELEKETDKIKKRLDSILTEITQEELKPRRSDVDVKFVSLSWVPYWYVKYSDGSFTKEIKISAFFPDSSRF